MVHRERVVRMLLQNLLKLLHCTVVVEVIEVIESDRIQRVRGAKLKLGDRGRRIRRKAGTYYKRKSQHHRESKWNADGQVRSPHRGCLSLILPELCSGAGENQERNSACLALCPGLPIISQRECARVEVKVAEISSPFAEWKSEGF